MRPSGKARQDQSVPERGGVRSNHALSNRDSESPLREMRPAIAFLFVVSANYGNSANLSDDADDALVPAPMVNRDGCGNQPDLGFEDGFLRLVVCSSEIGSFVKILLEHKFDDKI